MDELIKARVLEGAKILLNERSNVRDVARKLGCSKSTVHKDMRERLYLIDKNLYDKVSSILAYHIDIKHIRGGESTKRKFLEKKCN